VLDRLVDVLADVGEIHDRSTFDCVSRRDSPMSALDR
jgi:hypothetical protein